MATLSGPGYLWTFLSITAALLCCSGFYLPFWIQGRVLGKMDTYFNSFRRCNYPKLGSQGVIDVVAQCARYSKWKDIPSGWWQASTVLVCLSCVVTVTVAVLAVSACCVDYVIHTATVRLVGSLQLFAGVLTCSGLAVYPLGWDNKEVRDACGPTAQAYDLGNCKISWAPYLLLASVAILLVCSAVSPCITRVTYWDFNS